VPLTKAQLIDGDLLGIRLISIRLSDIKRVQAYLGLLAKEKIFRFTGLLLTVILMYNNWIL